MLDNELKKRILRSVLGIESPGLLNGKMGLCVYLFVMGRKMEDGKMSQMAEDILRQILGNLRSCSSLGFAEGLTGEALGLAYLVRENYVEGDVNDILLEVDQCIFKKVSGNFTVGMVIRTLLKEAFCQFVFGQFKECKQVIHMSLKLWKCRSLLRGRKTGYVAL